MEIIGLVSHKTSVLTRTFTARHPVVRQSLTPLPESMSCEECSFTRRTFTHLQSLHLVM